MRKYLGILSVLLVTSFLWAGAVFYAHAHHGEEHSASYNLAAISIAQDEAVDPESLGVGAPKILPGNPLYFFKNLSRGVRSTVTFGAENKAELKLQFANEKIAEAQILSERGDNSRAVEHLKSYEKDLARSKANADKEKFIVQSIKHQAVIDKIEKGASEEQIADINSVREKTIGHIAETVGGMEDKEAAKNALILATSDEGSAFKPLRNLEVLKAVEEKVPEQAKEAMRAAQENAVKRFKGEYDKASEEDKEALTEYVKSAGGSSTRYVEVFHQNKEVLGQELFGKLLSAGEEKKVVGETKAPVSVPAGGPSVTPPQAPMPEKAVSPAPVLKPAPKPVPKPAESVSKPLEMQKTEPVVEKKEEPKIEVKKEEPKTEIKKEEPKPYGGSPPLLY